MALPPGPPPGLSRPKSHSPSKSQHPLPASSSSPLHIASPVPQRPESSSWASSLTAGLFPPNFEFSSFSSVPHDVRPLSEAVHSAGCLPQPPLVLHNNTAITDLAGFPAPLPSDPWHMAHVRVCAHATTNCAACSVAFVCCSCRALRFTPGTAPIAASPSPGLSSSLQRSRSASPALFRHDVGNGPPPPGFDSHNDEYNDNAFAQAMADSDTCDNSACPRGPDEPATWTILVEQFDEGIEEFYDRTFRACSACNRSCRKSFLGHKIKSRSFDNSVRERLAPQKTTRSDAVETTGNDVSNNLVKRKAAPPAATTTAQNPMTLTTPMTSTSPNLGDGNSLQQDLPVLQDALRVLNARPPTPAAFVATIRIKHDASCTHGITSCLTCSCGLVCCSCKSLFTPAVARHLACKQCQHVAHSCCQTPFCCKCGKPWLPSDSMLPSTTSIAQRFRGGAGSV